MSLAQWERIKDYLAAKLGDFLYVPAVTAAPSLQARDKTVHNMAEVSTNLDRQGAKKAPAKSARHTAPLRD